MVVVELVGVHSVGKSTVALHLCGVVSGVYVPCRAVACEAYGCSCDRQRCFVDWFLEAVARAYRLPHSSYVVVDNSVLSTIPYSVAYGCEELADMARALWTSTRYTGRVAVLLVAPPHTLEQRCRRKYGDTMLCNRHLLEQLQDMLVKEAEVLAEETGTPLVKVENTQRPKTVAEKIARMLNATAPPSRHTL